VHPLAVAAPERQALGATAEDCLVLVGPRAVEHLDERELGRLGPAALLGVDASGGRFERVAVPAAVGGGGRREVAVDLLERPLEGGPRALELRLAGEVAADGEHQQDDDDDDQPGWHGAITARRCATSGARRPCA
jgi:hypothetical protein